MMGDRIVPRMRDARNLIFDADCALLDSDVKKARELLRQADRILNDIQKDVQHGQD